MTMNVELPYFDVFLETKERKKRLLDRTLNMHWGYWQDPAKAYTNEEQTFRNASENLGRLIYDIVDIKEGIKLADVGCGFGGTIDSINKQYKNLDLVGLNIDPRQIEAAKERVKAVNGNKIKFIVGNACDLPFEDESIDSLTAVECIFHFPDREKSFSEVYRVLKPGGKFAFSDFIPAREPKKYTSQLWDTLTKVVNKHYGSSSRAFTMHQYNEIASRYHLKNICSLNINKNVLPTYKAIYYVINNSNTDFKFIKKIPTRILELSQRFNQVLYMIIGYQKV